MTITCLILTTVFPQHLNTRTVSSKFWCDMYRIKAAMTSTCLIWTTLCPWLGSPAQMWTLTSCPPCPPPAPARALITTCTLCSMLDCKVCSSADGAQCKMQFFARKQQQAARTQAECAKNCATLNCHLQPQPLPSSIPQAPASALATTTCTLC